MKELSVEVIGKQTQFSHHDALASLFIIRDVT